MADRVQPMTRSHARALAKLHRGGIRTGFLSSLGPAFLRQLYAALPMCRAGFGFVAVDDTAEVVGFVACAESTGTLYKQALKRRGLLMALVLSRFIFRPSKVKRMWQTLRYPATVTEDLPQAEILSIAVADEARGKGIGRALLEAAMNEFKRRGIQDVKAAVGGGLKAANRFYQNCGFTLATTQDFHGLPTNLYVMALDPS